MQYFAHHQHLNKHLLRRLRYVARCLLCLVYVFLYIKQRDKRDKQLCVFVYLPIGFAFLLCGCKVKRSFYSL